MLKKKSKVKGQKSKGKVKKATKPVPKKKLLKKKTARRARQIRNPKSEVRNRDVQFTGIPMKVEMTKPAEVIEWPRTIVHHHTYGLLTPFFEGLVKGELRATRCVNSRCDEKRFWLPPRADCPDCLARMEWIKLKNPVVGEVFTYTHVEYPGQGIEISYPYYQIDVKLQGAATVMKGYLIRGEAKIGMKVKAAFRTKKPTNTILDLYWEPVE